MKQTFQSLLAAIMKRNNLTQRELARRAGINHISLCRILNETYAFRPGRTVTQLADAVGCSADERLELYRLAGILPPEIVTAFCASTESARAIWQAAKGSKKPQLK